MEDVWAILVWRLYASNKQYDSVEDLKIAISAARQNLEPNILQNPADSMKNHIYDLIMNKGGPISYLINLVIVITYCHLKKLLFMKRTYSFVEVKNKNFIYKKIGWCSWNVKMGTQRFFGMKSNMEILV
jgi:hypothetical protein